MGYDAEALGRFYDDYGEREWERLDSHIEGRIKYAIHRRFLDRAVFSGARVLDAGCGPGRFAIDVAKAGARITLLDISPGQLQSAVGRINAGGLADAIDGVHAGDICDLSRFDDAVFDVVVCYGGALSYVREHHLTALGELVRVLRPGGTLLLSAMSLWGTLMLVGPLDAEDFIGRMAKHIDWRTGDALPEVALTVPGSSEFHQPMALFSSAYLRQILDDADCDVRHLAAANPISRIGLPLERISANPRAAAELQELELAMCEAPGVVDCGAHIIAVATKR